MFSVNVWNSRLKCCHLTPTRGDCSVMSSRTSDQPLRRPDGWTCWNSNAAPRADDDWRNVDADDWRRQRQTYSSPPGMGELCVVDTDELSDRAWTELVREHRAIVSRHEEDVPSHGQLPSAGDETCCSVQHTLKFVYGERWRCLTHLFSTQICSNTVG